MAKKYTEFSFRKMKNAKKKQMSMKRMYGYKPSIFKVTNPKTKKFKYVVVKPKGLHKIR